MTVPKPRKLPSGNWFIQLRLGGESIGVTEPTEKKCIKSAQLIKAEYQAGKRKEKKDGKTVREACNEHINSLRSRRSPSTIQGYEKIVRNNLQSIMDMDVYALTRDAVDKAVDRECQKPGRSGGTLSPKTIANACNFLFPIIGKYNPDAVEKIALPEQKHIPARILRPEEVYSAVKGSEIELPCLLAMWMTLSISEIRGLTKSKSISGDILILAETVIDIDGKPVRKHGGKEETRARMQQIPPYIKSLIDAVEGDVICPLSSQATNKRLQRLLVKAGLEPISFHKLRHIAASSMVALGIPDDYILAAGGWKTPYVLNKNYKHIYAPEQQQYTALTNSKFDEIIKNANDNANNAK